jgi:hypothetical protein
MQRGPRMSVTKKLALLLALSISGCLAGPALATMPFAPAPWAQDASQSPVTRAVGTVKVIGVNSITLTPDSGSDLTILLQPSTRILRVPPGQKDLKDAAPIQVQDLQVGDRVLVRGKASDDGKSLVALSIVAMKKSDIDEKRQRDRDDWTKRGIGGIVASVDTGSGAITISTVVLGGTKTVAVHTSKDTLIRRYATDSVKFDDAKPGTLGQIQPGDQLRARGTRSADGSDLTAEEIVSGSFRNIAGTVASIDVSGNSLSVMDLKTKKAVVVKITADSQLRKLPLPVAQGIAMRLKGGPPGSPQAGAPAGNRPAPPAESGEPPAGAAAGSPRSGAPRDFQQILSRLPAETLADLLKGDAVMIVTTQGTDSGEVTAITLLSGVEPILTASPSGAPAMTLPPWNLGSPSADAAPQ